MKQLFPLLVLLAAACQSHHPSISGTIADTPCDSILVVTIPTDNPESRTSDTIALNNGHFEFHPEGHTLSEVLIYALPSARPAADGSRQAFSMRPIALQYQPGSEVSIRGTIEDYTLSGDDFYRTLNAFREYCRPLSRQIDSLQKVSGRLMAEGRELPTEIGTSIRQISRQITALTADYISEHPDTEAAVSLLANLDQEHLAKSLDEISERVRNGVMAPFYQKIRQRYDTVRARQQAAEQVREGMTAPDFTATTADGRTVRLSELRGKYVVLDFWGSWCGWCIKGIPSMKQCYDRHRDRMEIIGIACRDTEAKWHKALEEHQLPWTNVLNGTDPDLSILYAVGGYPTKYIIGPDGRIMKKITGERPEFYEFIDREVR